jgi:hypothetical protein
MKDAQRVKWARLVVLAGIVSGYLSYGTAKLGWGELYPFAHWRLYSAPIGINEPASTNRIYIRDEASGTWQRRALEPTPAFTRKAQSYVLGYWTNRVREDSLDETNARERLRIIAQALAPEASSHRVIAETFYSLPLYANPSRYDTSTVVRFDR